jgi:2-desacetyl-2-hydroxyethyl bacteriochlorophyllide A dehydrogenase
MRALTVVTPGTVELQQRDTPVAAPDQLVIAPRVVGVCGTDVDIIDGTIDPDFVNYPIVIGHEWAGEVMSGNAGFPVGTRVVVEGVIACGTCTECLRGATNRCATYDEYGFTRDGAAMESVIAAPELVHVIAPHVSWESAALTEPAAVVLRALQRIEPSEGERVLIVGDGTIAILAALLVRQWNPTSVTMLGAREEQRELAANAGVDLFTTNPAETGADYSVIVDAAGAVAATTHALGSAARGGKVVLLGYPGQGKHAELPVDNVINGDLLILGSFSYTRRAWADVVSLLNSGGFDPGFLVTHRFGLDDYASAIEALRKPVGTRGKVLLEVGS